MRINNKIKQLLNSVFGKEKIKKINTDIKCGVSNCKELAKYRCSDGLLSFFYVCENHKNIKLGEPIGEVKLEN